jgi:hypothetical protein
MQIQTAAINVIVVELRHLHTTIIMVNRLVVILENAIAILAIIGEPFSFTELICY